VKNEFQSSRAAPAGASEMGRTGMLMGRTGPVINFVNLKTVIPATSKRRPRDLKTSSPRKAGIQFRSVAT
jgi:hypothetical protein